MKWCDRCQLYAQDEAHFCAKCGYPLRVVPQDLSQVETPLVGDLRLEDQWVSGTAGNDPTPIHMGFSTTYYHKQRCVLHRSWGGKKEPELDLLPVPAEITTREALVAYVREQHPGWIWG